MPTTLQCGACNLIFAVGWYHYHESPGDFDAETLLVCTACGTMHSILHPKIILVPVLGGLFHKRRSGQVAERVVAQKGPRYNQSGENMLEFLYQLHPWEECKTTHVIKPKSKHAYMKDFLDLAPIQCHHCHRTQTIVKDWEYCNVRCPGCGKPDLNVRSQWMT